MIGFGNRGRLKQHAGWPQGPHGMQQQPLLNKDRATSTMPRQRAIMAEFHLLERVCMGVTAVASKYL